MAALFIIILALNMHCVKKKIEYLKWSPFTVRRGRKHGKLCVFAPWRENKKSVQIRVNQWLKMLFV